jgi:hypothetical protein
MQPDVLRGWFASSWQASELVLSDGKHYVTQSKNHVNVATKQTHGMNGNVPHVNGLVNGHINEHTNTTVVSDAAAAVPIAIIGLSFRFPQGMESEDSFWDALSAGRSAWSTFPTSRLNFEGVYDPDAERLNGVRHLITESTEFRINSC